MTLSFGSSEPREASSSAIAMMIATATNPTRSGITLRRDASGGSSGGVSISVTAGAPINVWSAVAQLHKCGDIDVPDVPAKIFLDDRNVTHMVTGSTNFHVMLGTPFNQSRSCAVAYNETGNPDPAMFAADEFLDATHAFDNGTVYALFDTEYPGNVYDNCAPGLKYPYCYMVSRTLHMFSHLVAIFPNLCSSRTNRIFPWKIVLIVNYM